MSQKQKCTTLIIRSPFTLFGFAANATAPYMGLSSPRITKREGGSSMSDEQKYWRQLIDDLNEKFTLEYIAKEIGVTERQVSNWKRGDRPIGLNAIRLVAFHMKHRTPVQES